MLNLIKEGIKQAILKNNQNTIKKINDSIIVSNMENSAGDPPPKKGVNWKH